jgi:hypothetical protein
MHLDVASARNPLGTPPDQPRMPVAQLGGDAMTGTGPNASTMIRVTHPGHAWLLAKQLEQRIELGRYVSLAEIIDQLIKAAETEAAP